MFRLGNLEVEVVVGDITEQDVDAVVNAANSDLWMGSGVAGAIKRKGGLEIEQEAMAKGPINPGEAVITGGGRLKAKYVIHCAGMPPGGSATIQTVRSSVEHAMRLAKEHNIQSIAFPAIGAGVGGLAPDEATLAIVEGIRKYADNPGSIKKVLLVGYSEKGGQSFQKAVDTILEENM